MAEKLKLSAQDVHRVFGPHAELHELRGEGLGLEKSDQDAYTLTVAQIIAACGSLVVAEVAKVERPVQGALPLSADVSDDIEQLLDGFNNRIEMAWIDGRNDEERHLEALQKAFLGMVTKLGYVEKGKGMLWDGLEDGSAPTPPAQAQADHVEDARALVAGLRADVENLIDLVQEQRALLVEVEDVCGRDGHGGEIEDGESSLIDKVRAHLATMAMPEGGAL